MKAPYDHRPVPGPVPAPVPWYGAGTGAAVHLRGTGTGTVRKIATRLVICTFICLVICAFVNQEHCTPRAAHPARHKPDHKLIKCNTTCRACIACDCVVHSCTGSGGMPTNTRGRASTAHAGCRRPHDAYRDPRPTVPPPPCSSWLLEHRALHPTAPGPA